MDPGTAIGVVSLSFQVFAGCIKCFIILSEARSHGKDASYLRTLVNYEDYRFVLWSRRVGLLQNPAVIDPRINLSIASDLMKELERLMSSKTLKERYKLELQDESDPVELKTSILSPNQTKSGQSILAAVITDQEKRDVLQRAKLLDRANSWPKKLWWAMVDKQRFEKMIEDVHALIDGLWNLLSDMQQDESQMLMRQILAQSIQNSRDLEELRALQAATSSSSSQTLISAAAGLKTVALQLKVTVQDGEKADHAELFANMDSLNLKDGSDRSAVIQNDLSLTRLQFLVNTDKKRANRWNQEVAKYDDQLVFAELKPVGPKMKGPLRKRVEDIVAMLSQQQPSDFFALRAIGFFEVSVGFRIVYEYPGGDALVQQGFYGGLPVNPFPLTLLEMLSRVKRPSLEARLELAIKICRTVLTLHVAGWLHKGLMSENILFFPTAERDVSFDGDSADALKCPFLAGFNFSRPDQSHEISEDVPSSLDVDIYRHPDCTGEPTLRFSRYMDMYGLATILIEIAEWWPLGKMVKEVCDISKAPAVDRSEVDTPSAGLVAPIRPWLIKTFVTKGTAAFRMGSPYARLVELCLLAKEGQTDGGNAIQEFHQALIGLERSARINIAGTCMIRSRADAEQSAAANRPGDPLDVALNESCVRPRAKYSVSISSCLLVSTAHCTANMNYPSRTDPDAIPNGWNQNPNALALDTNSDSNGIANLRQHRDHRIEDESTLERIETSKDSSSGEDNDKNISLQCLSAVDSTPVLSPAGKTTNAQSTDGSKPPHRGPAWLMRMVEALKKYSKFIGPGFMIAVAYIDPGNYATDVAAGASYRFKLLVMILVSNIIAIFLQSLSIKLGSVTGLNLAENCRAHLPRWLNYVLYFFAEAAIIATDIAEVIGTAIALNLLLHVPLVAGCAISIADVLLILLFYNPQGSMRGLRFFEGFVMLLVLGVVVCFCVELSLIKVPDLGELFRGYLPSHALIESKGLYQACGILGATVMPHSLYLGSGIVQPRLKQYDIDTGRIEQRVGVASSASSVVDGEHDTPKYKPSLAAIKHCLSYSIVELALSLFTFALFVNSAILIIAGASLSNTPGADDADLFGIHDLLSRTLAPAAGTVFALALLLSGVSAGIVCTIAGQMVSEGQLNWSVKPWVRRLMTRSISITPSIIIAGSVGRAGLSAALEGSQVALSILLPFTSAPLIYFTCRSRIMTVETGEASGPVRMRNGVVVAFFGVALWLLICVMNVALLVLLAKGT